VILAAGPGYEAGAWESFAVAEVGAAAALAGLLVVAASINIRQILELPGIVDRLGGTLTLFTGVLIVGSEVLVPGLNHVALGTVIALTGAALAAVVVRLRGIQESDAPYRRYTRMAAMVAFTAAALVTFAGLSCALGIAGGLYWLAPGVLLAFAIGLVNAWVALVEILR
jgi:hypothetical protein